jgi:sortase A
MYRKNAQFLIVASVTMFAAIIFSATLIRALWYAPEEQIQFPVKAAVHSEVVTPNDVPVLLKVPALSINANIQQTGINTAGRMATPSNFTDVAWYKYGPLPGQVGSAVIAGHVDNGLGLSGVFKHLGDIHLGDELDIETKSGHQIAFIVSATTSYPYTDVPTELLFNRHDTSRLNLITCEGSWVAGAKTYDRRLVVYAVRK